MLKDVPTRAGYLEAGLFASSRDGLSASLEAGFRPLPNLGLFAAATLTERDARAIVGARLTF